MLSSTYSQREGRRVGAVALVGLVAVLVLAACGGSAAVSSTESSAPATSTPAAAPTASSPASSPAAGAGEPVSVAFLAASSQNGYNQAVYAGIQSKAAELGNVTTTILDGAFDATVQFNQLQDVAASGKYDSIIIVPNDTVGIGAAVEAAATKDVPVVTVLFPIGPDLTRLEPQVDGVVSTVASPPAAGAAKQAELVADYCADKDPCNVVILIGQLRFPFDKVRYDAYQAVLAKHPNIKIVATAEGNYDRDASLTAMTDVIQANPKIDAVLSNADQQTAGAQIALEQAGVDLASIYLTGAGGTTEAIQAVRDGKWMADYVNFPVSMGSEALVQAVNAATGGEITTVIDADAIGPIAPFVSKADLDANPDFLGQWKG